MADTATNLPNLPCLCASYRRAARALTQLYDEALRPSGLRGTQFTLLQALDLTGEISQGALGQLLVIDSTTLTRTLRIMIREKWIAERRGADRRERLISLTGAGRQRFNQALPMWKRAQERLKAQLGDLRWRDSFKQAGELASLATQQGEMG